MSNIHELPRTMISYRRCSLEVEFLYFSIHLNVWKDYLSKSSQDRSIMVCDKQNMGELDKQPILLVRVLKSYLPEAYDDSFMKTYSYV